MSDFEYEYENDGGGYYDGDDGGYYDENLDTYYEDETENMQNIFSDFDRVALDIGDAGRYASPEEKLKARINIFVNDYIRDKYNYLDIDSAYILERIKSENKAKYLNPECLFFAYNCMNGKEISKIKLQKILQTIKEIQEVGKREKIHHSVMYIRDVDVVRYARFLSTQ